MYKLLFGAAGALSFTALVHFYSVDIGVKKEREKWKTSNVETLLGNNDHLKNIIVQKDGEFFLQHAKSIDTGAKIETRTHTITREIEVPVETIIKVEVPAKCDGDDINVNYDTLRLFNSWSEGRKLEQEPEITTTSDVPLVGSYPVQGDITGNGDQ